MEREAPPVGVDFMALFLERAKVLMDGILSSQYWEVLDLQSLHSSLPRDATLLSHIVLQSADPCTGVPQQP